MVAGSSALAIELRSSTVAVGDVLAEPAQLLEAAGLDLPHVLERGQPVAHRLDGGRVGVRLHDAGGGARVAEDPLHLLRRTGLVHRHGDRARAPDREVQQRPLVARAGHQADPVARLDPGGDQPLRGRVHLGEEGRWPSRPARCRPTLRAMTATSGCCAAFLRTMSVRFPSAGTSYKAGRLNSRKTAAPHRAPAPRRCVMRRCGPRLGRVLGHSLVEMPEHDWTARTLPAGMASATGGPVEMFAASHGLGIPSRTVVDASNDWPVTAGPAATVHVCRTRLPLIAMAPTPSRKPQDARSRGQRRARQRPRPGQGRRGRRRPDLPGRPRPLPRLRRPLARHLPRPVRRRRTPTASSSCAPPAASRRPGSSGRGCGPASARTGRGDREGGAQAVRRDVRRVPHPDVRHLRQRRHAAAVAGVRRARHDRARRGAGGDRRPGLRLRGRRPANADADALRDQRRGVRGEDRGGGRGRRALHAHPAARSPNWSTTRWRGASSGAAGPCWRRSAAPGPGTPCSGTSTSRWSAGCGSGRPSA